MKRSVQRGKLVSNNNNEEPKPKLAYKASTLIIPRRPSVEGHLLVCGSGDLGQLGLGPDIIERKKPTPLKTIVNVVAVVAGGMHNLVLTANGKVYSFGCNDEGALGRNTDDDDAEFEPSEIVLPSTVVKISAGDSHSACLLEDGRVFAWGSFRDSHGNMGLTLEGNKRSPINVLPNKVCCDIASGTDHLVILTVGGKVYTIGCAEQGQLGRLCSRALGGVGRRGKKDLLQPLEVITIRTKPFDAIWATNYCTFLRESKTYTIYAFGLNNYKQLGCSEHSDTVIKPTISNFKDIKQIAGGQHHTVVLKNDGTCHVIGRCDYGRLGLGSASKDIEELQPITALAGTKVVDVSCGEALSFALTDEGVLYGWGMGSNNQLGTGKDNDVLEPTLIGGNHIDGKRVLAVSSGGQHSIFLVKNNN